ncbi:MAG TPA: hypothetical protein VJ203_09805 [Bacteroidales bacterium]|nr:hypothetical protein [Bacteroidales bacterium]
MKNVLFVLLLMNILYVSSGLAQNRSIPGKITTPYPTFINLAMEWTIEGDDNANGVVLVKFREKGKDAWHDGMSLFRVPAGKNLVFTWKNKHSGSIFDVKPDTEYEIRLTLTDPDGGSSERTVTARTRAVPVIGGSAEIIDIAPGEYDTLRTISGTRERPKVYRCSKGNASFTYIDVNNRKWVYIEGLHVTNLKPEGIGIQMNGAENCMITGCTIHAVYGIVAYKPGAENCYICDNVLTGICEWTNEAMGAHGANIGEGIEMTGPGNVICYNRVAGFRDCISTMEDQHVVNQTCIDIYNNDIFRGADDAIEADFCFSNCRIFRNRITNCFVGLSSQPGLGGPNYFFRNSMYNLIHGAFKLKRFSQGDVVMHNTVVKVGAGLSGNDSMDYAWFRNNLAIGGPDGGVKWGDYGAGNPYAADIIKPWKHCSFDYDAVGIFAGTYVANIGKHPFSEIEKHGIEHLVLGETFENVQFPNPPVPEREIQDLRPKAGAKVIDKAIPIANMNDKFTGSGPDIGAYEFGQELPHYGPRNNEAGDVTEYRPRLFFREDWKEIPAATPVTQEHVANKDLVLSLYGPGADSIKKSHHPRPPDDPYYIWSGLCTGNWAVTLKNPTSYVDLSNFAKIVWRSKQSGLRRLHIILKLADGTWLVSDKCDDVSKDWRVSEFNLADITWYELDIAAVVEGSPVPNPDLSRVDEIGFTDLMRGGWSIACSRLDWIEVYGKAVPR